MASLKQDEGVADDAPPMPRPVTLAAAQSLEPYEQGHFDGTCGVYAIINALRLIAVENDRPLTWQQCHALFRHGATFLNSHNKLSAAVRYGLRARLWIKLAEELVIKAGRMIGVKLALVRPFRRATAVERQTVLTFVRQAIGDRCPVLLLLKGELEHYTVVVGASATRLRLFDSYGYHWIGIKGCSADPGPLDARHRIQTQSLMILFAGFNAKHKDSP